MWRITGESIYPKGDNPFGNKFYGYRRSDIETSVGKKATYHGVLVGDCIHVVALEDDMTTYLVRQERPNARKLGSPDIPRVLELPGGFVDDDQTLEEAANAELRTEIGRNAAALACIGTLLPSSGISNERDTIFLGTDLTSHFQESDEVTEHGIEIVSGNFGALFDKIRSGKQVVSAQTVAALSLAATHI